MRRTAAFKARKYTFKGIFFIFWMIKKVFNWLYHLIWNVRREAMENQGNCPKCKSLKLEYSQRKLEPGYVTSPFVCEKMRIPWRRNIQVGLYRNQTKRRERMNYDFLVEERDLATIDALEPEVRQHVPGKKAIC